MTYRPGCSALASALLAIPLAAAGQGDTCDQAMPITAPFTGTFDNTGATTDGPPNSCNTFGNPAQVTQWFSLAAPEDGEYVITITDATPEHILTLYTGECSNLTQIQCENGVDAEIRYDASAGEPLLIAVGEFGLLPTGGDVYVLDVQFVRSAGTTCNQATQIIANFHGTFDNTGAITDGPPNSCNNSLPSQANQWFSLVAPEDGAFRIDYEGSSEGLLTLYTGSCDNLTEVECVSGSQGAIRYDAVAGEQLLFSVGELGLSALVGGLYSLNVVFVPVPEGANCEDATPLTPPFFSDSISTRWAPPDDFPNSCNLNQPAEFTRWFSVTAPEDGEVVVSTRGVSGRPDRILTIYSGACDNLTEEARAVSSDPESPVTLRQTAAANETIYFAIGEVTTPGTLQGTGASFLEVGFAPTPGSACDEAILLSMSGRNLYIQDNSLNAPNGPAGSCNPNSDLFMDNAQWFTFTPRGSDRIFISASSALGGGEDNFTAIAALYRGTCDGLVEVECDNAAFSGGTVNIDLRPIIGEQYFLQVGSRAGPPFGGRYGLIVELPECDADVNGDGILTPADFNAWVLAFNQFFGTTQAGPCDQNGDDLCLPGDFTAWIKNYNNGCD